MAIEDQIVGVESGGDPNARNPRSTATGAGQFIDATWMDVLGRNRPDLAEGKTPQQILALRNDPALSREMTAAYARENGEKLAAAGHPVTPGTQYLAHFAGPQGALKVLGADPATPVASVLGPRVVRDNPFLANMTAADLQAWADKKMGGPAAAAPAASPQPSSPPAPLASPSGTHGAIPAAPAALPGAGAPAAGMLSEMLNAPQQDDPNIALLQQRAQQLMASHQPQQVPELTPITSPMPKGLIAARLRAAALRG